MKKITVTEENFERVLKKLQKICNKYKMLEFKREYDKDGNKLIWGCYNSIGFHIDIFPHKKFVWKNKFLYINKHYFRQHYEDQDSAVYTDLYEKLKSLIHIDLGVYNCTIIRNGDKIKFLPFGIFVIWTNNAGVIMDEESLINRVHIFIPDLFKGKIKNLKEEVNKRDSEWKNEGNYSALNN